MHLTPKFHHPMFTCSEVIVLTNKQTDAAERSNVLRYVTTLGNNTTCQSNSDHPLMCVFSYHCISVHAAVTLTVTWWPWDRNLTWTAQMKFLAFDFLRAQTRYRHTDRQTDKTESITITFACDLVNSKSSSSVQHSDSHAYLLNCVIILQKIANYKMRQLMMD